MTIKAAPRRPELHYGSREIIWFDDDFYVCSLTEDIAQKLDKGWPRPDWFALFYRCQPAFGSIMAHVNSHEMYLDAGRFVHFSRAMLEVDCRIDLPDLSRINDLVTIAGEMEVPWSYRAISSGRMHSPTFMFNTVADAVAFKLQAV